MEQVWHVELHPPGTYGNEKGSIALNSMGLMMGLSSCIPGFQELEMPLGCFVKSPWVASLATLPGAGGWRGLAVEGLLGSFPTASAAEGKWNEWRGWNVFRKRALLRLKQITAIQQHILKVFCSWVKMTTKASAGLVSMDLSSLLWMHTGERKRELLLLSLLCPKLYAERRNVCRDVKVLLRGNENLIRTGKIGTPWLLHAKPRQSVLQRGLLIVHQIILCFPRAQQFALQTFGSLVVGDSQQYRGM